MAILGIGIQSLTGVPLFLDSWSERLSAFREGSPILIAGFLSALSTFARSYKQDISYIRFNPQEIDGREINDPFGINGVYSFIGAYMFLVFCDPYQFREKVNWKLQWLYDKVLFRYEQMIKVGKVPQLTEEEHTFIEHVLMDNVAWNKIFSNKEQLDDAASNIIEEEYVEDVFGCVVTSFDNSILYSYGMDREETEIYLNNLGNKGAELQDREVLHNYVSLPGLEPRLVIMTNPGVKIQIADILQDPFAGEGGVPLYYYLITDANCSIGPIVESITAKFNAILL